MSQPLWVTPAGSLGTIPEGIFYQVPLTAYEPETTLNITGLVYNQNRITVSFSNQFTAPYQPGTTVIISGVTPSEYNGTYLVISSSVNSVTLSSANHGTATLLGTITNTIEPIYFKLIAGKLPAGIQIDQSGLLSGVPKAIVTIQGVPNQVSNDVTSTFVIRAYTPTQLSDQTFSLTVTGQDAPEFITPSGQLGEFFDGVEVAGIQIEYTDVDPGDDVTVRLISGELPPGLTLSAKGLISGFILPNAANNANVGFDTTAFDEFPYDFATFSTSKNFQFTLEVTDGKTGGSNLRTFSIFVVGRSAMTADTTYFTADNTFITADVTPVRTPIILNPQGSISSTRNDNFYAYQFVGLDLDGDRFRYIANTTPPGLTLNSETGWLSGYIPNLGLTDQIYDFSVQVYKVNSPEVISAPYDYSLEIIGPIDTDITWTTASNLGTIDNGATSILYVAAVNVAGLALQYRLKSGSNSTLPQGLQLLPSGDIAGRVSFDTFALDGGETTFDVGSPNIPIEVREYGTTFDMVHTFTVNAYSINGIISVFKTFSVRVIRRYNTPYENIYIQAMPPIGDRDLVTNLLQSTEIFPTDFIYRPTDPNFGIASKIIYNHAYGLTASTIDDYVYALELNHYWKNLVLGEIKTARALDASGNIIYEVVYSQVVDNLVNNAGVSVGKEVVLPYSVSNANQSVIDVVYPNSLVDMRTQVIDSIGQISNVLPTWMLSKQSNGQTLGFTPAWILCYAKPGKSEQIAYNIRTYFGEKLNLVDFDVDRYEIDRLLTKNWDPNTDSWIPSPPLSTTFDIDCHYQLPERNDSSLAFTGGIGYAVNDKILILGSLLGGEDGVNDVTVTVTEVNPIGTILTAYGFGTAPLNSAGQIYYNVVGLDIVGSGIGATWDLEIVPGAPTIFDENSVQFTAPSDMYSNTQEYDRYVLFPRQTILSPLPPSLGIVLWTNNTNQSVDWVNNSDSSINWINQNQ